MKKWNKIFKNPNTKCGPNKRRLRAVSLLLENARGRLRAQKTERARYPRGEAATASSPVVRAEENEVKIKPAKSGGAGEDGKERSHLLSPQNQHYIILIRSGKCPQLVLYMSVNVSIYLTEFNFLFLLFCKHCL